MFDECYDIYISIASVFGGTFERFVNYLVHNDKWIYEERTLSLISQIGGPKLYLKGLQLDSCNR
jgi:hypothetical protein